jgi:hypothetical protein
MWHTPPPSLYGCHVRRRIEDGRYAILGRSNHAHSNDALTRNPLGSPSCGRRVRGGDARTRHCVEQLDAARGELDDATADTDRRVRASRDRSIERERERSIDREREPFACAARWGASRGMDGACAVLGAAEQQPRTHHARTHHAPRRGLATSVSSTHVIGSSSSIIGVETVVRGATTVVPA